MDTAQTITHISLCSGYGGIDLGLRRCVPGLRTIAYSEIEVSAVELLLARMEGGQLDPAPIWSDLKSFPWKSFRGKVDILSGGYPCQPFSSAGKRVGKDDPRHLWPWIADGIAAMQPRLCFFENVEGHISLGLSTVVSDLEDMGYKVAWGIFSAAECLDASGRTAPHQRKRVFIMAVTGGNGGAAGLSRSITGKERKTGATDHGCGEGDCVAITIQQGLQRRSGESMHNGWLQCKAGRSGDHVWPSRPGEPQHAWEPPRVVGNATSQRSHRGTQDGLGLQPEVSGTRYEAMGNASSAGQPQRRCGSLGQLGTQPKPQRPDSGPDNAECKTEPALGGDADGPAGGLDYGQLCVSCDNRTDELRMLGNGVVPATAEIAFRTLINELC